MVHRNERIEFYLVRPDGKLFQVLVDVNGNHAVYINPLVSALEGVISKSEYKPGFGSYIFMAIPLELLRFDMQRTPVIVKGNIYRVRLGSEQEFTVWAPQDKGFAERSRFGTFILHFD